MPIINPKIESIIDLKGGGLDCDDVIMVIYFWILGGVWPWWRLMTRGGEGGKKCQKIDDVICEWPHLKEI